MSEHRLPAGLRPETEGSEQLFALLLDSAPDAMIIVDEQGKILIVNARAEKMFGYTREQLRDEEIELLIPARLRAHHSELRGSFCRAPELREMGVGRELFALDADGNEFPVEISLSPLQTTSGLYVSSVIRDITERRKMEQEIIGARQEAERANKANSAFLAAASHDLRQPVQALSLITGALRRTVKEPKALEMVDSLGRSITAMTNLLNSLLDISRLDAGAVTPELEDFPISLLLERLSAEFSRQAMHKGLVFATTHCEATVRSDPDLLGEIIQNLVSNGIRYTENGNVTLGCEIANGECRVEICDTGIGIDPEQIEQIFEAFHQCKTIAASNEGFGLGLAIVSRLADLLGHPINVESTPGKGSCFSVTVPVVQSATSDADDSADSTTPTPSHSAAGFVILVEDDPQVADALTLLFEAAGYELGVAASKTEAIALTKRTSVTPSLIVSDYHLIDETTGVDTIAALRQTIGENTPALIVTGDTSDLVEERSALSNCGIMSKPVDPDRLLETARQAVRTGKVPT